MPLPLALSRVTSTFFKTNPIDMDGNGRIGRFLMNAMLASGKYPWVIVPLERRQEYMNSLEIAGAETDILPFTRFIISLLPK